MEVANLFKLAIAHNRAINACAKMRLKRAFKLVLWFLD
jgi:hypothetical protein